MSTTTTLSFSGKNHKWNTAEDAQPVVDAILAASDLRCLALDGNTLGVEAAKVIGDALAAHPEFERAHWKDLFTGRLKSEIPDALRHLFSGLVRAGAKLKELDLSHNALGPVGVEGMVDFMCSPVCYSLEELRLDNNGLGIKGGTMLAQSLLKLVENAKAANTPLKLKVFISGRNRLENEGAEMFAKFFKAVGTLEHVAMPQNGIFHVGIAALASAFSVNPNLRKINLNDNTFTPKGAKAMAEKLLSMQNLEVIDFGDCLLKTAGAKHIADAVIDVHTKLQELRLDSNEIGVNGGLAVANAMVNKDNLKVLNLDGNQFGAEGREKMFIVLQNIGRLDALETLENDENTASEDEDTDEEEEDDEDEDDVQEVEPSGVSPLKRADAVIQPVRGTAAEFRAQPTAARLLGLGNSGPSQMVEEARRLSEGSQEEFIFHCFGLLMRTASLATSNNEQVQEAVKTTTDQLAETIFAEKPDDLSSAATNAMLIHLGLIKCEDKKFKLEWDLRGCLLTLAAIVKHRTFPDHTKNALQLFLSRPNSKIDAYVQEKHRLMTAIFQ